MSDQTPAASANGGFLGTVERIGNKLPDPAVLFIALLFIVWVLSWLLSYENIPQNVSAALLALTDNPVVILLIINVILLVVGIMLLSEGGHLAHLKLAGNEITPMTKTTFYFVIVVLVLTDIVQSRYRKKLLAERAATEAVAAEA